jgi:hypothetical protein
MNIERAKGRDEPMTATIENENPPFEYVCGLARLEDDQYVVSFPGHDENSSFRTPYEKTLRFGKYRNWTMKDVYVADIDYAWWLANLPWFRENHKRLVRAVRPRAQKAAPDRVLSQPESLPRAPRASREVTILAGGCRLIRPAAWGARP